MLYFQNALDGLVISDKDPNTAISLSGKHYGVEYQGTVYCNVYPEGLPFNEWVNSFHAINKNNFSLEDIPVIIRTSF